MKTIAIDRLNLQSGEKVLDIGCGEGRHLYSCYREAETQVVGLDTDPEALETFHSWFTDIPLPPSSPRRAWSILEGDAFRLPFRTNSFDVVICAEVLEHLPDYRQALREMNRVLKPNGRLAISVPKFFAEWVCWVLSDDFPSDSGGHVRIFREHQLKRHIESRGFQCTDRYGVHGLHTPFWWLKALSGHLDRPPTTVEADQTPDWWPSCLTGKSQYPNPVVGFFHQFLVWHIMKQPRLTRWVESLLNPWLGKSLVMHFEKTDPSLD